MNPSIPVDYQEAGRWLLGFVRVHAKREHGRVEAVLEEGDAREGRSYGVRLVLDGRLEPPAGAPPLELGYEEVALGRTRFAWCAALAVRVRTLARTLGRAVPVP
jgi:hypothetical protein